MRAGVLVVRRAIMLCDAIRDSHALDQAVCLTTTVHNYIGSAINV